MKKATLLQFHRLEKVKLTKKLTYTILTMILTSVPSHSKA